MRRTTVISSSERGPGFQPTAWDHVLEACKGDIHARDRLARRYWYPLYAYLRRKGQSSADASDLVQGFFAQLLAKPELGGPDAARGKFRTFLLTRLDNHVRDQWRREHDTLKRGKGIELQSRDAALAEERYALEPQDQTSPAELYDRAWAQGILREARETLRRRKIADGQGAYFSVLESTLDGGKADAGYAEIARVRGVTEGAIKKAVHGLRKEYVRAICDLLAREHSEGCTAAVERRDLKELYATLIR